MQNNEKPTSIMLRLIVVLFTELLTPILTAVIYVILLIVGFIFGLSESPLPTKQEIIWLFTVIFGLTFFAQSLSYCIKSFFKLNPTQS